MRVRAEAVPGVAHDPDSLSLFDRVAGLDLERFQMKIIHPSAVGNGYADIIPGAVVRPGADFAVDNAVHRRVVKPDQINAMVIPFHAVKNPITTRTGQTKPALEAAYYTFFLLFCQKNIAVSKLTAKISNKVLTFREKSI